jgi:hypothetical protein
MGIAGSHRYPPFSRCPCLFTDSAKEREAALERCWFCGKQINPKSREGDRHHLLARRYYKAFPKEDPHEGNVVWACVPHHRKFHLEMDDPSLTLTEFFHYMWSIDFGRNLYAEADQMAAD